MKHKPLLIVGVVIVAAILAWVAWAPSHWRALCLNAVKAFYNWNSFGELFAAVFGAFFGSMSAFLLGVLQQRRQRRDEHHEALLGAQYAMQSQWNVLQGIREQMLERMRADPQRHTKLPVFEMTGSRTVVPFDKLIFVAKEDDPDLLQQLRIAESCYTSAISSLSNRNARCEQFHRSPNVVRHSFNPQTGESTIEADDVEVFLLKQSTDALYHQVDRAIPKLDAAFAEVAKCIKRILGKRFRALGMQPWGPSTSPGDPKAKQ